MTKLITTKYMCKEVGMHGYNNHWTNMVREMTGHKLLMRRSEICKKKEKGSGTTKVDLILEFQFEKAALIDRGKLEDQGSEHAGLLLRVSVEDVKVVTGAIEEKLIHVGHYGDITEAHGRDDRRGEHLPV